MSEKAVEHATGDRCRCLRSKAMYLPAQTDEVHSGVAEDATHVWCSRTLRVIGPDDALVSPETCGPERSCFDPA